MATVPLSQPSRLDERESPTDDHGELICGRECKSGTRCLRRVPIEYLACGLHDQNDPLSHQTNHQSPPEAVSEPLALNRSIRI